MKQPISILAVDDEPGMLTLIRRYLADEEHISLTEAPGGKEALERITKGATVDLLITDLRMPEMEGDELAREVRRLEPDLKVLYLTGHADRLFDAKQQLWAEEPTSTSHLREKGIGKPSRCCSSAARLFEAGTMTPDDDQSRHEFKNQLGIILGFSEILLAEAKVGDPRRGDFEEIHKAATAALNLLARLFPDHADSAP